MSKNCSQYQSADSDDLFDTLDRCDESISFGSDLITKMNPWVNQPGYPVVTVKRNYEQGTVIFSQNSSSSIMNRANSSSDDHKWYIPINSVTESCPNFEDTTTMMWMEPTDGEVDLCNFITCNIKSKHWVIVNTQLTGM